MFNLFGKPKTYSPEELKQRYSRKIVRGKFNPDVYYNKYGNPEEWADRIKRHCDKPDVKNYSLCAKEYGPSTFYNPLPDGVEGKSKIDKILGAYGGRRTKRIKRKRTKIR